jgi:putative SOS response-associated peptidase YedK
MPVILHGDEWDSWLNGSYDDALAFQARCFPERLIAIERTDELWVKRVASASPAELPLLL